MDYDNATPAQLNPLIKEALDQQRAQNQNLYRKQHEVPMSAGSERHSKIKDAIAEIQSGTTGTVSDVQLFTEVRRRHPDLSPSLREIQQITRGLKNRPTGYMPTPTNEGRRKAVVEQIMKHVEGNDGQIEQPSVSLSLQGMALGILDTIRGGMTERRRQELVQILEASANEGRLP